MAATACAYGYQRTPRPPPPPLALTPARSSSQVPADPPFLDFDDAAETPAAASPPPPPPPPLPRPPSSSKAPPSFRSRHLGICTEGLGSESSGDIDLSDLSDDVSCNGNEAAGADVGGQQALPCKRQHRDDGGDGEKPGRARGGSRPAYPPPISVIGAGGKPWLYLRPHREDGRLELREVRIPSRELLQARREDGRFKLQFAKAQPEEEESDDVDEQHQCQPADAIVQKEGGERQEGKE